MGDGTVFQTSEGVYIGDAEVWERFESGEWTTCCWDTETGREWVETQEGDLLLLIPVSQYALPANTTITDDPDGLRIHSTQ